MVSSESPTGLSDLECWCLMSQPTAVSLCPCACSTPFYWLIGLQPRINRSILGQLLWHSDVTKGHRQTPTEHLPVTGAYGRERPANMFRELVLRMVCECGTISFLPKVRNLTTSRFRFVVEITCQRLSARFFYDLLDRKPW